MNPQVRIESYALSDIGLVRVNNEDVWAVLPKEQCFILADGMGGHQAGEVAAHEAVSHLSRKIRAFFSSEAKYIAAKELSDEIMRLLLETNAHVYTLSTQDHSLQGMGTTLCLALLVENILTYAHVGDSRIYRIRKNRIDRLTQDHSLRDEMIAKGELSHEMIINFPYKNVITRAIGTHSHVEPEIHTTKVLPGDTYFLCSDGLTDCLSDSEILSIISDSPTIQEAAENLVQEAKIMGGSDNITVIIFRICS